MRHPRWTLLRGLLPLALVAGLAVCADSGVTGPGATGMRAAEPLLAVRKSARRPPLLVCPGGRPQSASAVIDERGGSLSVGGQLMTVPEGAVSQPTEFTMTVPASRFMEIDISAAGYEHYTFERPISVVMDYTRCRGPELPAGSLSVWYIDPQTKEPLVDMGGVDEREWRRIEFSTDHLSHYALSW